MHLEFLADLMSQLVYHLCSLPIFLHQLQPTTTKQEKTVIVKNRN